MWPALLSACIVVFRLPQRRLEMIALAKYKKLLKFLNGQRKTLRESVLGQVLSSESPESSTQMLQCYLLPQPDEKPNPPCSSDMGICKYMKRSSLNRFRISKPASETTEPKIYSCDEFQALMSCIIAQTRWGVFSPHELKSVTSSSKSLKPCFKYK